MAVFLAGFRGLSRGKSKSNLNCNYPCHNPEAIQGRPKEAWLSFCQLDGEGGGEVECVEDGDPYLIFVTGATGGARVDFVWLV